jgi:hypothetical protein
VCFAKDHLRLERIQGLTRLELLVKANQGLTGPLLDSPVAKAAIRGCFIQPISGEIGDWYLKFWFYNFIILSKKHGVPPYVDTS